MRRYMITLTSAQIQQLHQMALEDHRTLQQQAAYLLDRAITQAMKTRGREQDDSREVAHASAE